MGNYSKNLLRGERILMRRASTPCSSAKSRKSANEEFEKRQFLDLETDELKMLKISHGEIADKIPSMTSSGSQSSLATESGEVLDENLTLQHIYQKKLQESSENLETAEDQNFEGAASNFTMARLPSFQIVEVDDHENGRESEKSGLKKFGIISPGDVQFRDPKPTDNKIKAAWQLDEKFFLSSEFPDDVWEEGTRNSADKSCDLLSESFPPLSATHEIRRLSFPLVTSASSSDSGFPSLSGRQCKVQLPSTFPGVSSSSGETSNQSPNEDKADQTKTKTSDAVYPKDKTLKSSRITLKTHLSVPDNVSKNRVLSASRLSPNPACSLLPQRSAESLAIRSASNEFLAARVVTQLNCAFAETMPAADEEMQSRANCLTPNLMCRRYSEFFFRPTTSDNVREDSDSLMLPSLYNECSKSLPNLREGRSKRVFVSFDKDFPLVKVVNLQGKSSVAQKCRLIDNELNNEDTIVTSLVQSKIKKKEMVKKWINSCT